MAQEADVFSRTFQFLNDALGDRAFKRWNGNAFSGKFLMSVFEVLATGVSKNVGCPGADGRSGQERLCRQRCERIVGQSGVQRQLRRRSPRDHAAQQAVAAC
jgi:hypothetical protein